MANYTIAYTNICLSYWKSCRVPSEKRLTSHVSQVDADLINAEKSPKNENSPKK